jgi:predicted methyltransferase
MLARERPHRGGMNESAPIFFLLIVAACGGSPPPAPVSASQTTRTSSGDVSPAARAIVDAPDRTETDRGFDAERHPAELLDFLAIVPGMHVGELLAGAGYTAELLARAVAPGGVVYAENPKFILERGQNAKAWAERLARPAMQTVVRVDRELDDPFPPEGRDLDVVVINLVYHDTVWLGVDRDKMNGAVFAALKKGGRYAVIDHGARPGRGLADVQTLQRIDEKTVRDEIEKVGFRLAGKDSFLRNPSDSRDWNDAPIVARGRREQSDRFALMFVKP